MLFFWLFAFLMSVHCAPQNLTDGNFETATKQYKEIKQGPNNFQANEDRSRLGGCFDINRKVRIPYFMSKDFSEFHREVILEGLADYERQTCLKFEELTPPVHKIDDFVIFFSHVPDIYPECNNTHYVGDDGKYNSGTIIRLNEKLCLNDSGRVEQLILSALGFIHEDARSDRDDYVIVLWDNIKLGYEGFFHKVKENVENWVLPYDFLSISNHYSDFHSEGGRPTLAWKDSKRPYQRNIQLSPLDVYKINNVFCQKCNTSTTNPEPDDNNDIFNQFGKFRLHVSFIDDLRKTKHISL